MTQTLDSEAVGVFNSLEDLDGAIAELEATAFPRENISVLGPSVEVKEQFGRKTIDPEFVMDSKYVPRKAPVKPEERALAIGGMISFGILVGTMATMLISGELSYLIIAFGALLGGAAGAVIAFAIESYCKARINKQVSKGGLLLWVKARTKKKENMAKNIMSKHGAYKVHINNA